MRTSAFAIIRNRSAVKSVKEIFDKQVLSLVLKCLRHEFDHNVLGQYFDSQNTINTLETTNSLKLQAIKLEITRASYFFGGAGKLFLKIQF